MSKYQYDILIGIKSIQPVLGGAAESTIMKWKKEYPNMPIRKIGGQWTTTRAELVTWWGCFVSDTLDQYCAMKVLHKEKPEIVTRSASTQNKHKKTSKRIK